MSLVSLGDISAALSRTIFDAAPFMGGGIEMEAGYWNQFSQDNPEALNRPFDPSLSQLRDDGSYESGGMQPGIEYTVPRKPTDEHPPEAPWYEVSLTNPFRLAFHGFKVPVLGLLSIVIEKTKTAGVVVYSLMYMALPTLAWFLGVDNKRFYNVKYNDWRQPLIGSLVDHRCPDCQGFRPDDFDSDEVLAGFNPWLECHHMVRQSTRPPYSKIAGFNMANYNQMKCPYGSYEDLIRLLNITIICDHPDAGDDAPGVVHIPSPTLDGLFIHNPGEEWKGNITLSGLKCLRHHPKSWHGWHPTLLEATMVKLVKAPGSFIIHMAVVVTLWNEMMTQFNENDLVYIQAISTNRLKTLQWIDGNVVLLYNEDNLPAELGTHFKGKDMSRYTLFRVPQFGFNNRSLASFRVFLAYFTNSPVRQLIVNQQMLHWELPYVHHLATAPYATASGCGGHTVPAFAGALMVRGRQGIASFVNSAISFYWGGCVYGWDEIYPFYYQKNLCTVYKALTNPSLMMGITPYAYQGPETGIMITNELEHKTTISVINWSRQSVYWVDRVSGSDVDPGRMTFWHVWTDPRPIVAQGVGSEVSDNKSKRQWLVEYGPDQAYPIPSRVVAPGDHILQELAAALGGISLFTIGTNGDYLPFKALANHLAKYGVPVRLYMLNTPEEGKILLASALGKSDSDEAVKIFNRARSDMLENMTGATLVHSALMTGDVATLDLTPPSDLVYSKTVAGSWLVVIASAILGVWYAPSARIGPYTGSRVLPTSHDGEHFLVAKQNRGRIPYGAVWGSDNEPAPGFEDIPLVPEGDHLELFRDYKNIVCHGGAGTVSTAAAAGARVIVPVGGLDRSRRNPYDAGLGLVPGADPDNIFLVLADQDIRFLAIWLRKNFWKPWKLWSFYGFPGLGWALFRTTMLYVLYSEAFTKVPVSSEPLLVLYGVLGGSLLSWKRFIFMMIASKGVDATLDYLNISYLRLLTSFVSYNSRLATSPVALFLAIRYNLAVALGYAVISPWAYKITSAIAQTFSNVILGCAARPELGQKSNPPVYLEFSPRITYYVPVLHTALVCPELGERYEGVNQGPLYVMKVSKGEVTSRILIPTTLTWDEVRAIPEYAGRYSLAWNCQTGLIVAFRTRLVSLGPGVVALYLSALIASLVYTINATVATFLWGLLQLFPQNIKPGLVQPNTFNVGGTVITSLWNRLSVTGQWDPVGVLNWWRSLNLPF